MDIEFKDPGRRRRLMVVTIGGVLAAAAGMAAFTMASNGRPADVAKQAVLVASHEVSARTPITADDVQMRDVPVDEVLDQAYTDPAQVAGRITSVPILPGQQVTPNLFATSNANSDFSILGPGETVSETSPDWRAVSLDIPPERAVGGEVKAGDHVDLIVTVEMKILNIDADGNVVGCDAVTLSQYQCGKSTKLTFQDLEVLKSTPDDNMYVFKVDLHQAEQISHILQEGPDSFTMVLRPAEDTRAVDSSQYGTTDDRLVMYFLFPAPQHFDATKLFGPVPYPVPGASPLPTGEPGSTPVPGGSGESPTPSGSPGDESPAPSADPSATPTP